MKRGYTRLTAVLMALVLSLGLTLPAAAAAIPPAWDETYYATLDCYGGLLDSSVVKSCRTRGLTTLTDYGTYEEVVNLTDSRPAAVEVGQVTFDLSGEAPEKFYFECKTSQPYEDFPWRLSLSYALNGVPTPAESLAGRSGLVEITLDAVPNLSASDYSRNNLVLTAVSLFNADDILSLEAPGAQVQLLGNLYCVLYAVLPGEEQHFTIRVGSEDFSYNGMVFLAVPATLDQLSQVADLKEAKEEAEDAYHAMNDSLHVILDTLEGMSGGLNAAADGLDQLNSARGTISAGKGQVYSDLDAALAAADALNGSLAPVNGHLTRTQEALTETTALLNEISQGVTGLRPEVENTRKILKDLQTDLTAARDLLDDLEGNELNARLIASRMKGSLGELQTSLTKLQRALNGAGSSGGITVDKIDIGGMTSSAEVLAVVSQLSAVHAQYEGAVAAGQFSGSFEEFLVAAGGKDPAEAKQMNALYEASQQPGFDEQLKQLDSANGLIGGVNGTLGQVNSLLGQLAKPTAAVMGDLSNLTADLESLASLLEDILEDVDDHGGTLDALLKDGKEAAALLTRLTGNLDDALDHTQELTDLLNKYEPDLQQALTDSQVMTDAATTTLASMVSAARSAEELLKRSGTGLDSGTRQTLSGLSETLRRSTAGLEQTGTVRNALDTIDALISDEWDSHAGGDNNLLLMDASAKPVSITDGRNENVASIQYILRSQEIKTEDAQPEVAAAQTQTDSGTIWTRIAAMFRDIWTAVTGLLMKPFRK